MNLLSHYACALGAPEALGLGAALPDVLGLYSRRLRLPPLEAHWGPREDTPGVFRDLLAGARFHHHVDRHFHRAPLFEATAAEVGASLRAADGGPGLKRFFPAHVLTELFLDHLLVRADPDLAPEFTRVLRAGQSALGRFVSPHPHPDAQGFPRFLAVILSDPYWEDYREVSGLFKRMNRILRRFGMRALTPHEERTVTECLCRREQTILAALNPFLQTMRASLSEFVGLPDSAPGTQAVGATLPFLPRGGPPGASEDGLSEW